MNKFYLIAALLVTCTSTVRAEEPAAAVPAATPVIAMTTAGADLAAGAGRRAVANELLRQFDAGARTAEGARFEALTVSDAWKERCGRATAAAAGVDGGLLEAAAAPFQAGANASAWVAGQAEPAAVAAARLRRLEMIKFIEAETGLTAGTLE